ncbi:MAG: ABC transporter permease [Ruminococcus sp.]|nr:ABC transporter permease [Ruminococcus sp.]
MINLLKEGFAKAKVSKRFWVCTAIIAAFSVLAAILTRFIENSDNDISEKATALNILFNMLGSQSLFMAIVPAMLVVRDFTQNTVRNKIICGCSRTSIYLAHSIVFSAIALFYHFVSIAFAFAAGVPLLGMGDINSGCFAYSMGTSVLTILAYASLTLFLVMIFRTVSGVIIAYVINSMLSVVSMLVMGLAKNDKVNELVNSLILDMQATILNESMASQSYPEGMMKTMIPVVALCYIIVLPIIGIRLFKKADLK